MPHPTILFHGGVALLHDDHDHVTATKTDILVEGNKIAKIGVGLSAPAGAEVVDCTHKIISPGFVSTHHHVWQTQLKGRHANETLFQYMTSGITRSTNYNHADFYWGQLAGCLEALDSGTTTVVDHSHMNTDPKSARYAIAATVSSGLRTVYCYSPTLRLCAEPPYVENPTIIEDWVLPTLEQLASEAPFGPNGRVKLGLGFDWFFLPKEMVLPFFERVKPLNLALVTSHDPHEAFWGSSQLEKADAHGLLSKDLLLSHSNSLKPETAKLLSQHGVHVSSTPSTELQMCFGRPLALNEHFAHVHEYMSLGIDCHSNNPASIVGEMRLLLQSARARRNEQFVAQGQVARTLHHSVEDAFNLGTVAGARGAKMGADVGRLAEGRLADLVLFDTDSPAMLGAAQHDPLAAVVLHSSPADISDVLVDGVFRKRHGRLVPVVPTGPEAAELLGPHPEDRPLPWPTVARHVVAGRHRIQAAIDKQDPATVHPQWLKIWGIDPGKFFEDTRFVDETPRMAPTAP